MNDLQIFKNQEFGQVRMFEVKGKPLFCGSDVAKALGYAIPSKAVNTHCKGVSKMEVPTNGGVQQMLFITEGDMYRLITNSKLPSAEKFEIWVFDEVLPSIRRTGLYNPIEISREQEVLEIIKTLPIDEHKNEAVAALMKLIPVESKQIAYKEPKSNIKILLDEFLKNDDVILKQTENGLAVDRLKLYDFFGNYGFGKTQILKELDQADLIYHKPECRTVQVRLPKYKNAVRVVLIRE